ncbi:MAG: MBL fold metallo-hydrolase [Deltaproteobacteria bacterium]|nr:MBL fold metallo-hydrolase [Deltaproteobacteria bacterium]
MDKEEKNTMGLTRREMLTASGLALGGLLIEKAIPGINEVSANDGCVCPSGPTCNWDDVPSSQKYTYFDSLDPFVPFDPKTKTTIVPLGENEMRITFMGSSIPPTLRHKQQMMSVFVEVGWDKNKEMPLDQFVFDCGSGVCTNYAAMNVGFGRMNKVFINHLHGDHMSDLTHIYCFGPSLDRQFPLYVWGPSASGVESPKGSGRYYDDGLKAFCKHLREVCRWHTESFSFQSTAYSDYVVPTRKSWGLPCDPVPVNDDAPNDGYALVPIELNWRKYGQDEGDNVAYNNPTTGVKISHFPVIHARQGSIGYKLEWRGLTMIYTSDTKPEYNSIIQASNNGKGVDVLIHEMIVPAQVWTMKIQHSNQLPDPNSPGVKWATMVQNSSHSPQGAFGFLLSQINPRPRLTVATHFPVADDTVACALKSVTDHCPDVKMGKDLIWSFDLMTIRVSKDKITPMRGVVSDFNFAPTGNLPTGTPQTPKYHDASGNGDPYAQICLDTAIPACGDNNTCNYREDGY